MSIAKVNIFLLYLLVWANIYDIAYAKVAKTNIVKAQKKSKKKPIVQILHARTLYGFKIPCPIIDSLSQDSQCEMEAFSGDVHMRRGKNNLTADSVLVNRKQKTMQAYGKVHFWDDSLEVFSEYLRYDGKAKTILFQRSVHVIRAKQELFSEELLYNRQLNTVDYYTGGHIKSDSMDIYSREGTYYTKPQTMKFRNQVVIKDTNFLLSSDSLVYHRQSRKLRFIAPTQLQKDSSTIYTDSGYYLSSSGLLHMTHRPVMVNKASIYTADTIDYNKVNGEGVARRNFSFYDSVQRISINSHKAFFNSKTKYFKATEQPFMIQIQGKKKDKPKPSDSLFMRGDTIISFVTNLHKLDSTRRAKIKVRQMQDSLAKLQIEQQNASLRAKLKASTKRQKKSQNINTKINPLRIKKNIQNYLGPPLPKNLYVGSEALLYKHKPAKPELMQDSLTTTNIIDSIPKINDSSLLKSPANLLKRNIKPLSKTGLQQEDKLDMDMLQSKELDTAEGPKKDSLRLDSIRIDSLRLDSLRIDSSKDFRIIITYRNVRLFRDSIQAIADSMYYMGKDSILSSYGKPVLWNANKAQFSADTIHYFFRKKQLKFIDGRGNSFTTRYSQKDYYDQVSSLNVRIFMDSNKVKRSLSIDSVNSITYLYDEKDKDKIRSVNVVKSDSLWAYYAKNKPEKVVYLRNVQGVSYPLRALPQKDRFLPQFNWQVDSSYRPKSKFDIIDTVIFMDLHLLSERDFKHYVRNIRGHYPKNDSLFGKLDDSLPPKRARDSQYIFKSQKEVPKSDTGRVMDRVRTISPLDSINVSRQGVIPKIHK